ncbi:MAG TPA: FHA domain-containing protein, partial [Steroidobacteraceae bacterium]
MNLTLEVVSQNGQSLGAGRRKVFGPEGGRIGRSPDCDWVIPNPYVSRHHATIRCISGTFYIESTGENGVAIGNPNAMLPRQERHPLRNGDRVFIDEYEIVVSVGGTAAEGLPPAFPSSDAGLIPSDDPLFGTAATRSSPALVDPLQPSSEELDPLKSLVGGSAPPAASITSPRSESSWNHTPGTMDHFAPPPVPSPAPIIPDDWDKTSFGVR